MIHDNSFNSTASDIFCVEQLSGEQSPRQNNTPEVLSNTLFSGARARETFSVLSVASPEPQIFTINSAWNEPTVPYCYGRRDPMIPPNINNLSVPPNSFNIKAAMEVVQPTAHQCDERERKQSPVPSELSSLSTPPRDVSTVEKRETSSNESVFYSQDGPRWIILFSSPSPPPPPRK